jgi:hypothetical protein
MLKNYRFWLWLAVVVLLLNALIHSVTLFLQPPAKNEIERQLFELMANYKLEFGAGFKRSMNELTTALSSCLSLLCLLAGLTLAFLLQRRAEARIMKGVVCIHTVVFGICFVVIAVFTFLPPIILMGLIFVSLLAACILVFRQPETSSSFGS